MTLQKRFFLRAVPLFVACLVFLVAVLLLSVKGCGSGGGGSTSSGSSTGVAALSTEV